MNLSSKLMIASLGAFWSSCYKCLFTMSYRAIRRAVLFGIVAAWALAFLCPALAQTLNDPKLHVRELASGLSQPTAMAFIGQGDILVLQKSDGRVRRVVNGVLQPGAVLDVAVNNASERG